MLRRFTYGVILCFILLSILPINTLAAAKLKVESEIGIENKLVGNRTVPLIVTISNEGESFSGDFVINAESGYREGAAIVTPIQLKAGETKTFSFYLDGFSESYIYEEPIPQYFQIFEGGLENGKEIDFEGDQIVNPEILPFDKQIYVVFTKNKDQISDFTKILSNVNSSSQLFYIDSVESPIVSNNAKSFEFADFILFDSFSISELSESEQTALLNWVETGGTVLTTKSTNFGQLSDVQPMSFLEEQIEFSPETLATNYTAGEFTNNLQVTKNTLQNGATSLAAIDSITIAASKKVGNGQFIQVAFPIQNSAITTNNGFDWLISEILKTDIPVLKEDYDDSSYRWTNLNELFPSLKFNLPLVIILIFCYLVIIGPLLYWILKKRDRREKMWFYVPIIALFTSIIFVIVAANDRILKPQVHHLGAYVLEENGQLTGEYLQTILSNRSGDIHFIADKTTEMNALLNETFNSLPIYKKALLTEQDDHKTLTIKDVKHWSLQSIRGESKESMDGNIATDLTLANGKLTGTVKNTLPIDLKDVHIFTGTKAFSIGHLKAGETLEIDLNVALSTLPAPIPNYSFSFDYFQKEDNNLDEEIVLTIQDSAKKLLENSGQPAIGGWTDEIITSVKLKGDANYASKTFIIQSIAPNVVLDGNVTMSSEEFIPSITPITEEGYAYFENNDPTMTTLGEGEYQLLFTKNNSLQLSDFQLNNLTISFDTKSIKVQLKNFKTGQFEQIVKSETTLTNHIQDYFDTKGTLEMKITNADPMNSNLIAMPTFRMEGVKQ